MAYYLWCSLQRNTNQNWHQGSTIHPFIHKSPYKPQPYQLIEIYRQIGHNYDERILPSIVNEVVKNVIAQYNAAQLLNQMEQVSYAIRRALEERSKEFFIVIDDVSITELSFSIFIEL